MLWPWPTVWSVWDMAFHPSVMRNCIPCCGCSTLNWQQPARSPTITGYRIHVSLALPGGVLRPICILPWPLVAGLITPVASRRPAQFWPLTRTPKRRFLTLPISALWPIGPPVCLCWCRPWSMLQGKLTVRPFFWYMPKDVKNVKNHQNFCCNFFDPGATIPRFLRQL